MNNTDWAVSIDRDTIELAPGVSVYDGDGLYVVVRDGVVVSLVDDTGKVGRLLASVVSPGDVPADTTWPARTRSEEWAQ